MNARETGSDLSTAARALGARRMRLAASLTVALALAVFLPTVRNGFVWDDHSFVKPITTLQLKGLARTVRSHLYATDPHLGSSGYWRPVATFSYWANARLGSGPGALHVGNVLLHALSAVLLFVVLARRVPGGPVATALAVAWWALHPANVEPVAWLSGRYELLSGAAAIALLAVPWRAGPGRAALHGALFLVGLLSKEGFLAMAPVLLVDDWASRRSPREAWPRWLAIAAAITCWAGLRAVLGIPALNPSAPFRAPLSLLEGVGGYLATAVAPLPLTTGRAWPTGSLPMIGLGAVAIVGLAAIVRRSRELATPAALFILVLTPSAVAGAGAGVAADRYFYLPSIGLAWLLCEALVRAATRRPRLGRLVSGTLAALVALGAYSSARRVPDWHDDRALFASAFAVDPTDPFAVLHVGLDLARGGRRDEALALMRDAAGRHPDADRLANAIAWIYLGQNEPRSALPWARRAVETGTVAAEEFWHLALALHGTGAHAAECQALDQLLRIAPGYPQAALSRAIAGCEADRRPGCEDRIVPFAEREGTEGAEATAALCELAIARGQRQAALECAERMRARAPSDPRAESFARRAGALR